MKGEGKRRGRAGGVRVEEGGGIKKRMACVGEGMIEKRGGTGQKGERERATPK